MAKPGLVLILDCHFPTIARALSINIVGNRAELGSLGYGVRVTIGAAAHLDWGHALIDLDLVVFGVAFFVITLIHVREIAAELGRLARLVRCLTVNGHQVGIGLVAFLIVVPKLFTLVFVVFAVGIDLIAERDLIVGLVGFDERIDRRACFAIAVAEALEQARVGENGVVRSARHADGAKRRCYLVGARAHAQLAKERCCRLGFAIVSLGRDVLHIQLHIALHLVDEQGHIGIGTRSFVSAVDGQAIECKALNRYRPDCGFAIFLRTHYIAAHQSTGRASACTGIIARAPFIIDNRPHSASQSDALHCEVAVRHRSQKTAVHIFVLSGIRVEFVANLFGLDVGVMEGDGCVLHSNVAARLGRVVAIAAQID